MDPAACQPPPMVLPSSPALPCSLLSQTLSWRPSRAPERQQEMPRRTARMRPSHALVNAIGTQRSRYRPASLAFKRRLESRDPEPSPKQFLSEDKMAARFNSLSLDSDHMYGSNGFPVQEENPAWQQAYTRLKELQRRLSRDGLDEEDSSAEEENECADVVVDGEFLMPDCPLLTLSSLFQGPLGGVSLLPEDVLLSLNPCTEVVLWSPPGNSVLPTIRTLMTTPSSLGASVQLQQEAGVAHEEMET